MKYKNTEFIRSNYELPNRVYFHNDNLLWSAFIDNENESSLYQCVDNESKYRYFVKSILSRMKIYYAFSYDSINCMIWLFESEEKILKAIDLYYIESIHDS